MDIPNVIVLFTPNRKLYNHYSTFTLCIMIQVESQREQFLYHNTTGTGAYATEDLSANLTSSGNINLFLMLNLWLWPVWCKKKVWCLHNGLSSCYYKECITLQRRHKWARVICAVVLEGECGRACVCLSPVKQTGHLKVPPIPSKLCSIRWQSSLAGESNIWLHSLHSWLMPSSANRRQTRICRLD